MEQTARMNKTIPIPTLFIFIISLLKPYKLLLLMMAFVGLFWAFLTTFTPYTLKLIIDTVVQYSNDKSVIFSHIKLYLIAYVFLWVVFCINMRVLDVVKEKLFPQLREDVMTSMFAYLNLHSHRFFQNNFAGSLINKIIDMQSGVIDILTTLDDLYAQALGITLATIILLFIHPIFAFILVAWIATFLIITMLFLKPIQNLSAGFAESKTKVVGRMVDSISNIAIVRLFARYNTENQFIYESVHEAIMRDKAMQRKIIKMRLFWDASIIVLMGLNLFILIDMYSKNSVTIGDFTFVMSLSISILWNLWFLASQFVSFSEKIGICRQALSFIAQPHEIVDGNYAYALEITRGNIKFQDVTFYYEESNCLFRNKNIEIQGGEKIGLVGYSGSGKSTFVNLILRLFEIESGHITIDDQNIKDVTQESLRKQIALIPQDVTLFHRTLLENIRFGNPAASDDMVIDAAKSAHCHEFIINLPQGYQTLVGERGIKLSGGQRQRIAIARAFLKNAPILILDEATSSLDSITEHLIAEGLDALMQGKTTIVIAHRLSTLAKMDRIIVFDHGQIIEDGPYASLLAMNGHYAKMWHMQAGGFLPDRENNNNGSSSI